MTASGIPVSIVWRPSDKSQKLYMYRVFEGISTPRTHCPLSTWTKPQATIFPGLMKEFNILNSNADLYQIIPSLPEYFAFLV
jgi:hypothetical protein